MTAFFDNCSIETAAEWSETTLNDSNIVFPTFLDHITVCDQRDLLYSCKSRSTLSCDLSLSWCLSRLLALQTAVQVRPHSLRAPAEELLAAVPQADDPHPADVAALPPSEVKLVRRSRRRRRRRPQAANVAIGQAVNVANRHRRRLPPSAADASVPSSPFGAKFSKHCRERPGVVILPRWEITPHACK